jgi:hypothetical protein
MIIKLNGDLKRQAANPKVQPALASPLVKAADSKEEL